MSRARKLVNRLLEADEEKIDWSPDPEAEQVDTSKIKPELPRFSSVKPGDAFSAPIRIVLHTSSRDDEWVTHMQNMQDKGFYYGNYFRNDYEGALKSYYERCKKYGVEPL